MELPPKYYHDNFEYLLGFVKEKYGDLLLSHEWQFLRKYYGLSEDAQCLFIRFTNRKGLFFKTDSLNYPEIEQIDEAINLLLQREFISQLNTAEHLLFVSDILNVLTKPELVKTFGLQELKSAKREIIVQYIKENFSPSQVIEEVNSRFLLIKVNFEDVVSFLKFLFFGNRTMDMTEFVLRDLGLMQYYKQNDDDLVARFSTRKEAEDKWLVSEQYLVFSEIKNALEPYQIFDWYSNFQNLHKDLSSVAKPSFQKLQLIIGKHFEKVKTFDLAIEVYRNAEIAPARERMVRSMAKAKHFEEAKLVCEEMIKAPLNVDEQYFAEFFLVNLSGKKNKKQTTEFLNKAESITISNVYKKQVELGAIEHFLSLGYNAGFSENLPWRGIFGLLFWDIIFDPSLVAFHHPFQRRPSDLYLPDFYEKREKQVLERLSEFETSEELVFFLWKTFEDNYGTANPFVVWDAGIWEMVRTLASHIPLDALKCIMNTMATNLVENSRGMPDILIWNEDSYELIEIKSPNDTLSNQQLFWLKFFKDLGVNAKVLRVYFEDKEITFE